MLDFYRLLANSLSFYILHIEHTIYIYIVLLILRQFDIEMTERQ